MATGWDDTPFSAQNLWICMDSFASKDAVETRLSDWLHSLSWSVNQVGAHGNLRKEIWKTIISYTFMGMCVIWFFSHACMSRLWTRFRTMWTNLVDYTHNVRNILLGVMFGQILFPCGFAKHLSHMVGLRQVRLSIILSCILTPQKRQSLSYASEW